MPVTMRLIDKFHRLHSISDVPSLHYQDGTKKWHRNGKLHRDNDAAVIFFDGRKLWYKNGILVSKNFT